MPLGPKARSITAQGEALGTGQARIRGLKARHKRAATPTREGLSRAFFTRLSWRRERIVAMSDTPKIDAKLVKELREKSGAPMGDCLKALQEAKGDMENAFVVLRKRGMASAAKKASRTTNEGAVGTYIHAGGKIGVLIELNCESDFVARTDDFQELLRDIAMHIAAVDPRYVGKDEVTAADIEKEKEIYRAQAAATGKPANIIEKMLEGKMSKFYEEVCLLDQPFIKEQSLTIAQLIAQKIAKLGENISVRRFARFKNGETNSTLATAKVSTPEEAA